MEIMKSKFLGVSKLKNAAGYKAVFQGNYIGCFETAESAAIAVDDVIVAGGIPEDYWRLNFPDEVTPPTAVRCSFCKTNVRLEDMCVPRGKTYQKLRCRICRKTQQNNPQSAKAQKTYKYKDVDTFLRILASKIKNRSKVKQYDCEVTYELLTKLFALQNGKCALSGLPMTFDSPLDVPSVDRIDSTLGYTQNNVQLVCWKVNKMKSNLTQDEFIALCRLIAQQ